MFILIKFISPNEKFSSQKVSKTPEIGRI